jgi:hypothetical protein
VQRRTLAYVAGGIAAVATVWVVGDLLIVTDEERLEPFLDAVTGDVTPARIDAALAFTDPSREPVEVRALGTTVVYEDAESLSERAHTALSALSGETLRILGESIEVEGERATISVRILSGQTGMVNVGFDLRKHGDDWLVRTVRVTR